MKKNLLIIIIYLILFSLSAINGAAYILENFDAQESTEGFYTSGSWSIKDGAFYYNNSEGQPDYFSFFSWVGGDNSDGSYPSLAASNYFFEFAVSVTVNCVDEAGNYYGLIACSQKDSNDKKQYILFRINKEGYYRISEMIGGEWKTSITRQSQAITGENDHLTLIKQGALFRFLINGNEVEFLILDGHPGGGVGIASDQEASPLFDDFEIVDLSEFQPFYDFDAAVLTIPLLDAVFSDTSRAYNALLEFYGIEPLSFNLIEFQTTQISDEPFSQYDIFNLVNFYPFRPSFDLSDNRLHLPAFRINGDDSDEALLIQADFAYMPTDEEVRFELNSYDAYHPDCSRVDQNRWIFDRMMDIYYWYDHIPSMDNEMLAGYATPKELLEAITFDDLDRWSYITSQDDYFSLYEDGTYVGVGYKSKYDDNGDLRISAVYSDSPVDRAGIQRGWKLIGINGKRIREINDEDLWDTISGEDEIGVTVSLEMENLEGEPLTFSLDKELISINTVYEYNTFTAGDKVIGYLVFMSFLETSEEELTTAFAYFKQKNVDELILDLRYNGGGKLRIAAHLASLISGEKSDGKVFESLQYNDKHPDWNYHYRFETQENALNLSQVIIITTDSTASASEFLINGLKPFLNVVTIGSTTHGKPVGMNRQLFCDQVLVPILFGSFNADDEGGYFDGIDVTCRVNDDLIKALGDPDEASLKEALYYLENNHCSDRDDELRNRISTSSSHDIPLSGFRNIIDAF